MSSEQNARSSQSLGISTPFNSMSESGHYALDVSSIDTLFIRVPDDAIKANRSPLINITDKHGNDVQAIKVGDNFDQSLTKARMRWADNS